jgi:hypothetical protein
MKKIILALVILMTTQSDFIFAQCETTQTFTQNLVKAKRLSAQLENIIDISPGKELEAFNVTKNLIGSIKTDNDYIALGISELDLDGLDCLSEEHEEQITAMINNNVFFQHQRQLVKNEVIVDWVNSELSLSLKKKLSDYSSNEQVILISSLFTEGNIRNLIGIDPDEVDQVLRKLKESQCLHYKEFADDYLKVLIAKKW